MIYKMKPTGIAYLNAWLRIDSKPELTDNKFTISRVQPTSCPGIDMVYLSQNGIEVCHCNNLFFKYWSELI